MSDPKVKFSTQSSDWIPLSDLGLTEDEFNDLDSGERVELCEQWMQENMAYRYEVKNDNEG